MDGEGKPKATILHKRRIEKLEVVFDEKSRSDFIHGFRKRRKERQEFAKDQAKKKQRQEKSVLKKQKWDILDKKVKQVESAKVKVGQIYKEQLQSTTAYESGEKIITATVAPLFGNNDEEEGQAQAQVEEDVAEDVEEDMGTEEMVAGLEQIGKKIQNVTPKTKPKRRPQNRGDDDGGTSKKRRGGGGGKRRGGKH